MARDKGRLALRKKPSQRRSRDTVDVILTAATGILVEHGWAGFTTNAVARRAGVNIASLYQYFPDKRAIVAELQSRHVGEVRARVEDEMVKHQGDGPQARARTLVEAAIAAHRVAPELHRVFEQELPRSIRHEDPPQGLERAVAGLIELGLPRPELSAWIVSVVVHALVHEAVVDRRADVESGAMLEEVVWLISRYVQRP
jgi:AcrR family transcriptional regulator